MPNPHSGGFSLEITPQAGQHFETQRKPIQNNFNTSPLDDTRLNKMVHVSELIFDVLKSMNFKSEQ